MTAPRIRALERNVVDVIAAGEVVERPASVVKELVENALDAGATRIEVTLEDGGKALIRVADDGEGMGPDDLALAFAPHATSKIRAAADLDAVATYGFRGEALASIGAVSEARITSRARDAAEGWTVVDDHGERAAASPAASPPGTTVEIRRLFAGVPARRKFLRAAGTETARATEVVTRFSLGRPDVAFSLVVDGRTAVRADAGESLAVRAARALGTASPDGLLPVDEAQGDVRVRGFVVRPDDAGRARPPQILVVNGRLVQDRTIGHAVGQALEGLLTVHHRPAWLLAVDVPPGDVDVNVHPQKSEVRFRRPGAIHDAVRAAVRHGVLAAETPPALALEERRGRDGIRDALAAYLGGERRREHQPAFGFAGAGGETTPAAPRIPAPGTPGPHTEAAASPAAADVLQVRNAFLVFEAEDGIAIVDQHALHERVVLEELRARVRAGEPAIQGLLVPEVVETDRETAALVEEHGAVLRRAGLVLERFGEAAVAAQGVPAALAGRPVRPVVEAALERLAADRAPKDVEALLHGVLETMACHGAVRAGDPLPPGLRTALLEAGRALDTGGHCAHGRPTELRIPWAELEKRFRRT